MYRLSELVVPWVTLWSAEEVPPTSTLIDRSPAGIRYRDEMPADRLDGFLWHREGIGRGVGTPVWSQVHARRQRLAMLKRQCQVCGCQLPIERTPWLIPRSEYHRYDGTDDNTSTAPTCESCWPIAASRCPHIRTHDAVALYGTAKPWGVIAGLYHPLHSDPRVWVPFGSNLAPWIIAKQMAVTLSNREVVAWR